MTFYIFFSLINWQCHSGEKVSCTGDRIVVLSSPIKTRHMCFLSFFEFVCRTKYLDSFYIFLQVVHVCWCVSFLFYFCSSHCGYSSYFSVVLFYFCIVLEVLLKRCLSCCSSGNERCRSYTSS